MDATDKTWVERCLDGRREDYRHLVDRWQAVVLASLRGRLGSAGDAEDAAQEAFVRAFVSLRSLRRPEAFGPWIVGIASRVAKETLRDGRRSERIAVEAARRRDLERGPDRPAIDEPLSRAIADLPEALREVVLLRFHGGLACAEIAERLGVRPGTVTKSLSRAYALLRRSPHLSAGVLDGDTAEVSP